MAKKDLKWVEGGDLFEIEDGKLVKFRGDVYKERYGGTLSGMEIPEDVSAVAERAFEVSSVRGVRFLAKVDIMDEAFAGCKKLVAAEFRGGARVGSYAFRGCGAGGIGCQSGWLKANLRNRND